MPDMEHPNTDLYPWGDPIHPCAPGYWKRAPGNPKMTYCPVTMLGYMAVHQNVNKSKSTHPIWMGFFLN